MDDTKNLLMALIDALGYEVEASFDYKKHKLSPDDAMRINSGRETKHILSSSGPHGALDIDEDGMYTAVLKVPEVNYTVTKKD